MSLVKSTAAYSISNLVLKFGGVLLLPLMTRLLSPNEYGVIGLLMTISSLLTIVIGFGLYNPQNKMQSKYKNKKELGAYLSTQLILFLILNSFFSFVYILFINSEIGTKIYLEYGINYHELLLILILSIISGWNVIIISYFKMDRRYYFVAIISIISFSLFYGLAFTFITLFSDNVVSYIFSNILSQIVISIFLSYKYIKLTSFSFNKNNAKYAIKMGFPVIFTELSGRVIEASDRLILARFISMAEVGVYILASTGGRILSVFISGYTNSLYQYLYDDIRSKRVISSYSKYFVVITILVVFGQLLSKPLIPLIFPSDYTDLHLYFSLILPIFALQYFYFLDFYFHVSEDSKYIPIFSVFISVLSIVLNFVFIQKYGVYGAVISTYLCLILRFSIQSLWIKIKYDVNIKYINFIFLSLIQFLCPYIDHKNNLSLYSIITLCVILTATCIAYIYVNIDEIKMVNNNDK